jgi:CubicO group peptidase (beta-lactamase class C family)
MKTVTLIISLLILFHIADYAQGMKSATPKPFIAFSYPVSKIIVDGDTADWPKNSMKFNMTNFFGNKPKNKEDISAYYKTGYNSSNQSLYFVAVVTDNSHVTDTSKNPGFETQDAFCLYLDGKNRPSGSGVISYQFNDKWKNIPEQDDSWDPEVRKAGWGNVQKACKRNGTTTVYEFKITLRDQIFAGKSSGMDLMIIDKDPDDSTNNRTYVSWGDKTDKAFTPGRLGYVILMKAKEQTGTINGTLGWKDDKIKKFPDKMQITSVRFPSLLVQVPVDTTGSYSVTLPVGLYEVSPVWCFQRIGDDIYRIDRNISKIQVNVTANNIVNAPILKFSTVNAPDLIPEKGIMFDFDDKKAAQLDNFVKAYQEYYLIPGVSLALIKDGKVIYHKTYGVKNGYTGEPVDDKTLFEAASVTKTVFAFAVNRLVEKGIIDLDKPLYQYLPFDEIASDDRYKLMTARHVLSHQTGLQNWGFPEGKEKLKFTPGTGYGYSGEGFEYLKRVVVKITGKDIETVLNEEVLQPLGLQNIFFTKNEYLASVVANGHFENFPTRSSLPIFPGMAWSMYTEVLSFSKYVLALMNHTGLKPETYNEMFKFQVTLPLDEEEKKPGLDLHYGLGIALENTPFGNVFEHGGNNGDFQCQFKMFRDLNMGYVIFTNSDSGGKLADENLTKFLITGKPR